MKNEKKETETKKLKDPVDTLKRIAAELDNLSKDLEKTDFIENQDLQWFNELYRVRARMFGLIVKFPGNLLPRDNSKIRIFGDE